MYRNSSTGEFITPGAFRAMSSGPSANITPPPAAFDPNAIAAQLFTPGAAPQTVNLDNNPYTVGPGRMETLQAGVASIATPLTSLPSPFFSNPLPMPISSGPASVGPAEIISPPETASYGPFRAGPSNAETVSPPPFSDAYFRSVFSAPNIPGIDIPLSSRPVPAGDIPFVPGVQSPFSFTPVTDNTRITGTTNFNPLPQMFGPPAPASTASVSPVAIQAAAPEIALIKRIATAANPVAQVINNPDPNTKQFLKAQQAANGWSAGEIVTVAGSVAGAAALGAALMSFKGQKKAGVANPRVGKLKYPAPTSNVAPRQSSPAIGWGYVIGAVAIVGVGFGLAAALEKR